MRISRTTRALRIRREKEGAGTLALVALGAVAGLAIGMALADRFGGVDGLARRAGLAKRKRHKDSGWRGDSRRSAHFDDLADDDSELAPEAMSHLHFAHHESRGTPAQGMAAIGEDPAAGSGARRPGRSVPPVQVLPTGEELEQRVLEAFQNDPILSECAIDITAEADGSVELSGWVALPSEVDYAVTITRGVPGVQHIVNSLVLRPSPAA